MSSGDSAITFFVHLPLSLLWFPSLTIEINKVSHVFNMSLVEIILLLYTGKMNPRGRFNNLHSNSCYVESPAVSTLLNY